MSILVEGAAVARTNMAGCCDRVEHGALGVDEDDDDGGVHALRTRRAQTLGAEKTRAYARRLGW